MVGVHVGMTWYTCRVADVVVDGTLTAGVGAVDHLICLFVAPDSS